MIRASELILVAQTYTTNDMGDSVPTETQRTVFCEVKSIGLKRKLEAEQFGLKLAFKFVLSNVAEYNEEPICIFNSVRYNIVDAYVNDNDQVELTVQRF